METAMTRPIVACIVTLALTFCIWFATWTRFDSARFLLDPKLDELRTAEGIDAPKPSIIIDIRR
jgi:hypothetical protein